MLKKLRNMKGQSTLEYAVLIIIIIGALLSIQVYIKRGIQGRLRSASDDIGDQFKVGGTNYKMKTTTYSKSSDTFVSGVQKSTLKAKEYTNMTSNQAMFGVDQDFWGKTP